MTRSSGMNSPPGVSLVVAVMLLSVVPASRAAAGIEGISGTRFDLVAEPIRISTPDGSDILAWGLGCASCGTAAQYPAPTLLLEQGARVTITLTNRLFLPGGASSSAQVPNVSLVFPGQDGVETSGGVAGRLTAEAVAGGDPVTYSFTASHPGTFSYHSGTRQELEIEMGLVGAIVVRPAGAPTRAYEDPATAFDRETLFVVTEMDRSVHDLVDAGLVDQIDSSTWWPTYWFLNGRAFPDTLADAYSPSLPSQPYGATVRIHPGEKLLIRTVGAGRSSHSLHTDGNHARIIAMDGRLLESTPGAGPDLSWLVYSLPSSPGETMDALFTWTGEGLGWDVYGHASKADPLAAGECVFDGVLDVTRPECDHGKPFPVSLPAVDQLEPADFWSGSPFLGKLGAPVPGHDRSNSTGGYFYMWHSSATRELVNGEQVPGGMATTCIVEPPDVPIP